MYGRAISLKLPVDGFKWKKKNTFQFNENFIQNYYEGNDKIYILEVNTDYPKRLQELHSDLPSLTEEWKSVNVISLYAICILKKLYGSKTFKTSIKSWSSTKKSA